jgi:hypothetical protein
MQATSACLLLSPHISAVLVQRLAASAEEVAFNDPPGGAAECMILNEHLWRLLRHSKLSAFQRFIQGVRSPETPNTLLQGTAVEQHTRFFNVWSFCSLMPMMSLAVGTPFEDDVGG